MRYVMQLALAAAGTVAFGVIAPAKAEGILHLISPCAPADVLGFGFSGFQGSSPVFVNGRPVGELGVCDAKSFPLPPGTHNVRVKLAGMSDYGISSDAGIGVTVANGPVYLVMDDKSFASATIQSPERGRRFLDDVRTVKGK